MSRNQRKRNNNLLGILIILLIGLGLGYALLSQDLTINGTSKVKGNNWDIHFNNVQISSGSVALSTGDAAAAIDSNDNTLVTYTITLNEPGDFYEFTVDVVNAGTIDGMIGEVINKLNGTVISASNPLPVYLKYTFSYADGTPVAPNHLLAAGTTETYKVRVEFNMNIANSDLPTTEQTNTFSFGVSYLQRTSAAIAVPHPVVETVYTANTEEINIGSPIPNGITQYATAAEAMAALKVAFYSSSDLPFCLKHEVSDDVVTASYVEFVVTSEMANNNPGMTAGTYSLRGAGLTRLYDEMQGKYYYEDIPFEENKIVLQTAFGASNCTEENGTYDCSASYLRAGTTMFGDVVASTEYFSCGVTHSGCSDCDPISS